MTLEEALTLLRTMLPDFNRLLHSDASLKDWLEQGANEVAALTLCYERRATFTHTDSPKALMAGAREYFIAGAVGELGLGILDALQITSIHLDHEPLTMMTARHYHTRSAGTPLSGQPKFWYEFAGRVGFRPIPDAAVLASYTMDINYAAAVGAWTGGESVLPAGFQDLSVRFAFVKAKAREEKWSAMAVAFEQWFEQIQTQPLIVMRPATHKGNLSLPATEPRRLQRRRTG